MVRFETEPKVMLADVVKEPPTVRTPGLPPTLIGPVTEAMPFTMNVPAPASEMLRCVQMAVRIDVQT